MRGTPSGTDVAQLLSEAADLSRRAADLAKKGRVDDALEVERQADEIRKRARRIAAQSVPEGREPAAPPILKSDAERGPSARSSTIAALAELGVPTSPRALADYAFARFGTKIDHRALPSLRRDEVRAWASTRSNRAVYIVPALEGNRFLPVRAKLTLSEWPIERRLIGPWSERTDHLRATLQIAKQVLWLKRVEPSAGKRLEMLLAAYAASVLGAAQPRGSLDIAQVEKAANGELAEIGEADLRWRSEAAERARSFLNEEQLLWGASLPEIVQRKG